VTYGFKLPSKNLQLEVAAIYKAVTPMALSNRTKCSVCMHTFHFVLTADATYLRCLQEFVFAQAGIPGLTFAALETGRSTERTSFFARTGGHGLAFGFEYFLSESVWRTP